MFNIVHSLHHVASLAMHSRIGTYNAIAAYSGRNSAMPYSDAAFERLQGYGDVEVPGVVIVSTDSRIPIIHCIALTTTFTTGIAARLGLLAHPFLPPEPSFDLCVPVPVKQGQPSRNFHAHFIPTDHYPIGANGIGRMNMVKASEGKG